MAYTHGVYVYENPTSIVPPITADSAVQFVVGTAPINLLENPAEAVNKPIVIYSFAEAVQKIGYSDSFDKFSICECIDASFRIYNVAPLVVVNVLDPEEHVTYVVDEVYELGNGEIVIDKEGVLLKDFLVKSQDGMTTYEKDIDYTVEFTNEGYIKVTVLESGSISEEASQLSFAYDQLDPTVITEADIIGGYDAVTGKYTGLENINQVYPRMGIVPGLIVCPGWSNKVNVGKVMSAKTEGINGSFKCNAVKDIDTTADNGAVTYSDVKAWKGDNDYTGSHDIVCWPMVKVGSKKYHFSALAAALIAYTDAVNEGVPYVSPSNKQFRISGTILEDGREVYLDQVQANLLNGNGITTAINVNGWKSWGSRTGAYPASSDPKDSFIPVRRMFDWWGNTFIMTYFQKVDDPMNKRLIESIVDSENIRANGYKARGQIADARMEFVLEDNPITDLLNGSIRFKQYLTPYPPSVTITNVLEFDPAALTAALGG